MTRVNYRRLTALHGVIMKYGLSDLTCGIYSHIHKVFGSYTTYAYDIYTMKIYNITIIINIMYE